MKVLFYNIQQLLKKSRDSFSVIVLIALACAMISAAFAMTIYYEMHLTTQESLHLYLAKFTAAAISSIEHNLHGFVGYNNIYKIILDHGTIDDQILKQAVAIKDYASGGIYRMSSVDIGYFTFAKMAFLLFGYSVKSLLLFYFFILIISVAAFFYEYRNKRTVLCMLIVFLLAFYTTGLKSIYMPLNVGVIYSFRFISLLAILPLIHVSLFIFMGKSLRANRTSLFLFIVQSIIIIWNHYIRLSVQWMFIAIFSLFLINACAILFKSYFFKVNFWKRTYPLILFFMLLAGSKIIMNSSIHDLYKQKEEGSHVFWHSLYVGLALHPEIRKVYTNERPPLSETDSWIEYANYRPNDQDSYSAAFKWLYKNGKDEFFLFNFRPDDRVNYKIVFSFFKEYAQSVPGNIYFSRRIDMEEDYKWAELDKTIREVVIEVIKNHPLEVFQVVFIIKPIKFFQIYTSEFLQIRNLSTLSSLAKTFSNVSGVILFIILCYLSYLLKVRAFSYLHNLGVISFLFLFSLIIPCLVYPEPWNISDQASLLTMLLYWLIIIFLRWIQLKWDQNHRKHF